MEQASGKDPGDGEAGRGGRGGKNLEVEPEVVLEADAEMTWKFWRPDSGKT